MLKLGTKAQTLEVLKNYFEVPIFTKFTVLEFNKDKKNFKKDKKIPGKVIIRSSSIKEDTSTESGAGNIYQKF